MLKSEISSVAENIVTAELELALASPLPSPTGQSCQVLLTSLLKYIANPSSWLHFHHSNPSCQLLSGLLCYPLSRCHGMCYFLLYFHFPWSFQHVLPVMLLSWSVLEHGHQSPTRWALPASSGFSQTFHSVLVAPAVLSFKALHQLLLHMRYLCCDALAALFTGHLLLPWRLWLFSHQCLPGYPWLGLSSAFHTSLSLYSYLCRELGSMTAGIISRFLND